MPATAPEDTTHSHFFIMNGNMKEEMEMGERGKKRRREEEREEER